MTRLELRGLGGGITVVVDGARLGLDWLPGYLAAATAALDRFDPASELRRLNRRPDQWLEVSELLWGVLETSLAVARGTGGLVTPTVLSALVHAGYSRRFTAGMRSPATAPGSAPPVPDVEGLELCPRRRAVRLRRGTTVELGGFAKGYLADRFAARIAAPALVDLGGDIAVNGPRADGSPWPVATERCGRRAGPLLELARGGVATSGRDHRRWVAGAEARHHLIDPRTGEPAVTDVWRATVLGPSAVLAEAAAKLVLLHGRAGGLAFVDARPELEALVVDDRGRAWPSERLAAHTWSEIARSA